MQAGARHPMPLRRHLSRTLLVLSVFAPWALLPAAAGAATLQTVQSTAGTVAPPVGRTAEDVADVAQPALDALTTPPDPVTTPSDPVTAPSDPAGEGPIAKTVDPIAHGTGATEIGRAHV